MRALCSHGCWAAGALLAMGTLGAGPPLAALPATQQAAAAQEFNRAGHAEGKVVLAISAQAASH